MRIRRLKKVVAVVWLLSLIAALGVAGLRSGPGGYEEEAAAEPVPVTTGVIEGM